MAHCDAGGRGIQPIRGNQQKGSSFCFKASSFADIVQRMDNALTHTSAAQYLNVTKTLLDRMLEEGFFPQLKRSESSRSLFEVSALNDFLERLLSKAKSVQQQSVDHTDLPFAARSTGTTIINIIRLVLDDKLKIERLESARGFMSVTVKPTEIEQLLYNPESRLTARELLGVLGASTNTVKFLIDTGNLESTSVRNPKAGTVRPLVERAEVVRFQQTYVGSYELAKSMRLPIFKVLQKCHDEGIVPAFDPQLMKAHFYLRTDIPWI